MSSTLHREAFVPGPFDYCLRHVQMDGRPAQLWRISYGATSGRRLVFTDHLEPRDDFGRPVYWYRIPQEKTP